MPTTKPNLIGTLQRPGQRPENVNITVDFLVREMNQFFYSENTIYEDTALPDERNVLSIGPVMTIYSGVTVSVGANSVWTIAGNV